MAPPGSPSIRVPSRLRLNWNRWTHGSGTLRPWQWRGCWQRRLIAGERQLPLIVLLVGLAITAGFSEQKLRMNQQLHERIEAALMGDVAEAIAMKLQKAVNTINGVAGLFNASSLVSRREFSAYYNTLNHGGANLAGLQGIGFSAYVPAHRRQAMTALLQAEGYQDFTIHPTGNRAFTSTIIYLEPSDLRHQRTFGYDMYSEGPKRAAMDLAATNGVPIMSGKVRLIEELQFGTQTGTLIYAPVYRDNQIILPQQPQHYEARLLGWVYMPIEIKALVEESLNNVHNPDLNGSAVLVYDGSRIGRDTLMFDNQRLHGTNRLSHPQYQTIEVAGRNWLIGIQLSRALIGKNGTNTALFLQALAGCLASAVAAISTRMLVQNHLATRSALDMAEKANNELALATVVFESSSQGIVITNEHGVLISTNQSFGLITGYAASEVLGRTMNLLKSGRHEPHFYSALWRDVIERGSWQGEIWNRLRNGEIRRHELSITTVRNKNLQTTNYVGMLQDVNIRHHAQEMIRHKALHDQLTGLPNRELLLQAADQALAEAELHPDRHVGILFLDLNGFKPINDIYGHAVGDQVLRLVAQRLRGAIRTNELLSRLGGDEFVVLVPNAASISDLYNYAGKLLQVVIASREDVMQPIDLGVSIGIALSPDHGIIADQLLTAADYAMYRAKRSTLNRIKIANEAERQRDGFGRIDWAVAGLGTGHAAGRSEQA